MAVVFRNRKLSISSAQMTSCAVAYARDARKRVKSIKCASANLIAAAVIRRLAGAAAVALVDEAIWHKSETFLIAPARRRHVVATK